MIPKLFFIWLVGTLVTLAISESRVDTKNHPITEIPFEVAFRGVAFVSTKVNAGPPLQFILDTGGAGTHIDLGLAKELGLEMGRGVATASGNAQLEVGVIRSATTQVGEVQYVGQLIASPLGHLEPIFGRKLDGILGSDWMRSYVVEMDYIERRMRLYEPSLFSYNGKGATLPLTFFNGIPFMEMEVSLPNNKVLRGSFLVDTAGGWMAVHVYNHIANRERLLDGLTALPETGVGIGGATQRVAARGKSLSIGPYRTPRPTVKFTEDASGLRANPASVGLVGMEVFRKFRVTFDYSRKVVHLEPNELFNEPFVYDASGLRLRAAAPLFSPPSVTGVRDSSPAKIAGILPGDIITKLNGRDTTGLSLEVIREKLHPPDRSNTLTLLREGKALQVVLKTREMLP
jgi:hypothetical protein